MSLRVSNAVLENGPNKGALRYPLLMLAHQADDYGFAAEDQENLAALMAVDLRTVQRNLANLEEEGWIRVERKVLEGRASIYLINCHKLGLGPLAQGYRHKLFKELMRVKKALQSGGKLSSMQGVMKFEKPSKNGLKVLMGDLFPEDEPDGNLPSESEAENAFIELFEDGDTQESLETLKNHDNMPLSDDIKSGDTRQIKQVTHDNLSLKTGPFNTSSKSSDVVTGSTPLAPEGHLVLPNPDVRPGDGGWLENSLIAARWVLRSLDTMKSRWEPKVAEALEARMRSNRDESLVQVAELAVDRRRQYLEAHEGGELTFGPWSLLNFLLEAHWQRPQSWPYKPEHRVLQAGAQRKPVAFESAFEAARVAAYLESNADLLVDSPEFAERLRDLAGEMRSESPVALDDLDRVLTKLESDLFAKLEASLTDEESAQLEEQAQKELAPYKTKMTAEQLGQVLEQFLQKRLFQMRAVPRLSIFYMPQP